MTYQQTQTGQLQKTSIANCPVFIPVNLTNQLLDKLVVNSDYVFNKKQIPTVFHSIFEQYFCKFFAGNKSLKEGFSDLPIENLFLWQEAKIAQDVYVKQLNNGIKKFKKILKAMLSTNNITIGKFDQYNKMVLNKNIISGIRKGSVRVGKPDLISYAFYAPPHKLIKQLLENVFAFLQRFDVNILDKMLISMMQLFFIHPFMDGNGRIVRALSLSKLQNEIGWINAFIVILYFKNINVDNYYLTLKAYREGKIKLLKSFHRKAIEWTNQSIQVLSSFINEYIKRVTQNKIDTDVNYSQIVIKADAKQKLDKTIFQFHSKKASKSIYINTALLNVLNQFDYYLRYELRKHQ